VLLFEAHWRGITFAFRSNPYSGYVAPLGEPQPSRAATIAMVAAGPLVNAMLLGLAAKLVLFPPAVPGIEHDGMEMLGLPFLLANALILCVSLYPSEPVMDKIKSGSDGLELYRLIFRRPASTAEPVNTFFITGSNSALARYQPSPGFSWKYTTRTWASHCWAARTRFLLHAEPAGSAERLMQLDAFGTGVLMFGARRYFNEALRYANELVTSDPTNVSALGTKGSLLIATNQIEEGLRCLEEVWAKSNSDCDRAISAAFIALGECKQGNVEKAESWLTTARKIDANFPCIDLIESVLQKALSQKTVEVPACEAERTG
jgi:hypothetical protein